MSDIHVITAADANFKEEQLKLINDLSKTYKKYINRHLKINKKHKNVYTTTAKTQ